MDIRIIKVIIDVFNHYGDTIRFDYERFEEALNDEANDLLDECYLIVLGMKMSLFDAMIFDEDIDLRGYVSYLVDQANLSEDEALFMVAVFNTLIQEVGYYFEIPDIDVLLQDAYQRNDFEHLSIIARTYFLGFGVAQDYEKAFEIYSYLYGHGDDRGAYYLGYMYEHGYGVETDIEKALLYYESRQDDLTSFRLGIFYMFGQYVPQDYEKAYDYLSLSHYEEAYLYKGILLEMQREHAQAFLAYHEGAKLFQVECLYKAGLCLKLGLGVEINLKQASCYFQYAYYLLHGESAYELSMMYFDGLAVLKDEKKALKYLHQSASLYCQDACLALGQFYQLGRYVKRNDRKAKYYYQEAESIRQYTLQLHHQKQEDES